MKNMGLRFSSFRHNAFLVSAVLIVAGMILYGIITKSEFPPPAGIQEKDKIVTIEDKTLEKKSDVKTEVEDGAALKKSAAASEEKDPVESMPADEEKTEIAEISQLPKEENWEVLENSRFAEEEHQEISEDSEPAGGEMMEITEEFQTAKKNNTNVPETPQVEMKAELQFSPYTILLSSFQKLWDVKRALRHYELMGLSPFWTRVDLGEKGVWYGIFAGHYENSGQAADDIFKYHLMDAVVKKAEYTVLVGEYDSEIKAGTQMNALTREGFSTYLIRQSNGKVNLYSGAFYTEEAAGDHSRELTSIGPICTVVKR